MLRELQSFWQQLAYFSFLRFVPRNLNSSSGSWNIYIYITPIYCYWLSIRKMADCYLVDNLFLDLAWNKVFLPKKKKLSRGKPRVYSCRSSIVNPIPLELWCVIFDWKISELFQLAQIPMSRSRQENIPGWEMWLFFISTHAAPPEVIRWFINQSWCIFLTLLKSLIPNPKFSSSEKSLVWPIGNYNFESNQR